MKVTVIGLGAASGSHLATAQTPQLAQAPGAPSQYVIASQAGTLPDLGVIYRGARTAPASLQLYSGASGFQTLGLDARLPIGPLPAGQWTIALGSVESAHPDILVATRSAATPTGHLEIHVLRGDHGYQAFGEQAPIALPASAGRSMRLLITHAHGFAALYGVDAARRIVVLLSLAPLRGYDPRTHTLRRT